MTARSLRARLALGLTVCLVALWALGAVAALSALRRQTDALFDSALQETAERLMPLILDDLRRGDDLSAPRRIEAGRPPAEEEDPEP